MRIKCSDKEYHTVLMHYEDYKRENGINDLDFYTFLLEHYSFIERIDKPMCLPDRVGFYQIVEKSEKFCVLIHDNSCYKLRPLHSVNWIEPKYFAQYHKYNLKNIHPDVLNKYYKNVKLLVEFWFELRDIEQRVIKLILSKL